MSYFYSCFSRICDTPEDLKLYQTVLLNVSASTPRQILQELECPIPCELLNFKLEKVLEQSYPCRHCSYDTIAMELTVNDGVIEVLEEKPLYNVNNFIADVGGYLGLLLGASVLTIYQDILDFVANKGKGRETTV